jgi:hypothetical protein
MSSTALAQEQSNVRKFVAVQVAKEFNHAEVKPGVFIEYLFHSKKNVEAGIKGGFIFGGSANSIADAEDQLPAHELYDYTKLAIGATGYWYPNQQKVNKGIFLCGEAGLMRTMRFFFLANNLTLPWASAGLGYKWVLRKNYTLRLSTSLTHVVGNNGFGNRTGIQTTLALGN